MENENTAQEAQQENPVVEQAEATQEGPVDPVEVVCVTCGAHYSKGDTACPNISNHQ